ncbi:hypothetical protein COJ93_11660 [Bacillus anthracis]|nr:hypothetical protein CON33_29120 [Bacillus anthracis]PFP36906.1 hypothetical protein COJ93_11660 [Bacillus anthracis]
MRYSLLLYMLKICSKCKQTKEGEEFGKDRSKKDGLTSACRECNNRREKKRRENGGDFTQEQKRLILEKYSGICRCCGSTENLEIDHRLPQSICNPYKASVEENGWLLCKSCNIAKGTKILFEVITEIPLKILGPMLSPEYANPIARKLFKEESIMIGTKQYKEIKLKEVNKLF